MGKKKKGLKTKAKYAALFVVHPVAVQIDSHLDGDVDPNGGFLDAIGRFDPPGAQIFVWIDDGGQRHHPLWGAIAYPDWSFSFINLPLNTPLFLTARAMVGGHAATHTVSISCA